MMSSHLVRLFAILYFSEMSQLFWMSVSASPTCPDNSITIWNSVTQNTQCQDCRVCPAGQGLSVNCGDVITPQTPIFCKPCEEGITYSSKSEAGACKSCMNCGEYQETIKSCTLTSKAVCGKNCKLGAYPEGMLGTCRPCSACCNDGNDIFEPQCQVVGVPKNKQCSELRSEKCRKKIASAQVNTTAEGNHSPPSPSTNPGSRMSPLVTVRPAQDSASKNDVSLSHGAKVGIGVGVLSGIVILAVVICIVKTKCKRQACKISAGKGTEKKNYGGKEKSDSGGVQDSQPPGPHSITGEVSDFINLVTRFTKPE